MRWGDIWRSMGSATSFEEVQVVEETALCREDPLHWQDGTEPADQCFRPHVGEKSLQMFQHLLLLAASRCLTVAAPHP